MKTIRDYVATGLFLVLAVACDNHSNAVDGEMIAAEVELRGVSEGGTEEVLRSASVSSLTGHRAIATVSQPLDNGLLLDMSLEPDESSPLRATKVLEANKTFRVIALDGDGKYVSHGDYAMTGGGGVSKTGGDLHVPGGVSHDFICLSYNSTAGLPAASFTKGQVATLDLSPDGVGDFLYEKVTKALTASDRTLSFTLIHQYSNVSLMIDGSYNEWAFGTLIATGLYLKPDYSAATMKLQDWSRQSGTAATDRYFTGWTSSGTYTQTSTALKVFTAGQTITLIVPAHSLSVNSVTCPGIQRTVSFSTASTLVAGHSYTLRLRIRQSRFAGSNIYWDAANSRLTFDPENVTTHQGYQGVFFRWGSLVGISPARVTSAVANADAFIGEEVPLYVPTGYPSNPTWKATTSSQEGYNAWKYDANTLGVNDKQIPYIDGRNFPYSDYIFDRSNTYGIDPLRNTTEMYQNLRGDICQYLSTKTGVVSGDYRLPLGNEFGIVNDNYYVIVLDWNTYGTFGVEETLLDALSADGTTTIIGGADPYDRAYAEYAMFPGRFFPATGRRNCDDGNDAAGALQLVGKEGSFWTGSRTNTGIQGGGGGMHMYFSDGNSSGPFVQMHIAANRYGGEAYPVRCAKN